MIEQDFVEIREALAALDASASHTASGESRPKVEEIFAPEHHAGALDPNVIMVQGARGSGKSFWAGVLGNEATKSAASELYPRLGLNAVSVRFGFTGMENDGSISRATIDRQIPSGEEGALAGLLWRCVILRAMQSVVGNSGTAIPSISALMKKYADPEKWERDCSAADTKLRSRNLRVLVVFDALDAMALDWGRLRQLLDALLEASWSTRGYPSLRVKLFLRPDQVRDLGLRFVELPKMIAGSTRLQWNSVDLYGMLFVRLAGIAPNTAASMAFSSLVNLEGLSLPPSELIRIRDWPLARDTQVQARVFARVAGAYMGRSAKKGRTYDWAPRHLADGHGEVTPRSFMTLMIEAARHKPAPQSQVISAEGIRHGLREASKVRVNQLEVEFRWIKRVLVPLARLQVPSNSETVKARWQETQTVEAIMQGAAAHRFLPPFDPASQGNNDQKLIETLVRIGVLFVRADDRVDMPDLFRVAARLLKKGGVAPA